MLARAMVQHCPLRKVARDGDTSLTSWQRCEELCHEASLVKDDRPLHAEKKTGRVQ